MSAASRYRARFHDPDGVRYGMPTYPWGWVPDGLATRPQLRARGLRPGGQQPCAQVRWMRHRIERVAYLYRLGWLRRCGR